MLSMGVHLSQHSADSVVLHAQLLNPLLVIGACLVRDWHVLELSFLGEVDVVHCTGIGIYAGHLKSISSQLSLSFKLSPLGDHVSGSGLLLYQFLAMEARLGGNDHLYVLVSNALDRCLFVHIVSCTGHAYYGHGDYNQNSY